MDAKNHQDKIRDMGIKLANFRRKLAALLSQKKITQAEFGEMFGGYSSREINSYETGSTAVPGLLYFILWMSGASIDGLFAEAPIPNSAREKMKTLYEQSALVGLKTMDAMDQQHFIKEVGYDEKTHSAANAATLIKSSGKRAASGGKTGKIKKR
jgi:transcriptional regulator with XRE-family HTH domain